MRLRAWFRAPRHLLVWSVIVTAVPMLVLFVMGWRLLEGNGDLAQQLRERLQVAANLVAADLRGHLDRLAGPDASDDTLLVSMTDARVTAHTGAPLLFAPVTPPTPRADDVRATATVRRAVSQRTARRFSEALDEYGRLATMGDDAWLFGSPAPLEGALARLRLLVQLDRGAEAGREALELREDLYRGRWQIDRTSFENAWIQANEASAGAEPYPETFVLASAAQQLFREWTATRSTSAGWSGRRGLWLDNTHVTVLWSSSATELTLRAIPVAALMRSWSDVWRSRHVTVSLVDTDGRSIVGEFGAADEGVSLVPSESGLPWTIRVASVSPDADLADALWRRRQLQIVLGLAVAIGLMGAYFVARAVRREFAVAQLQKDFVSAVSHEFRTPLTSMSHLLELLKGDRPLDDGRRRKYYDALERETGRLRQFVDTLLDFGRVESGVAQYDVETVDTVAFVSEVVERFRHEPASEGRRVEMTGSEGIPQVSIDRQALGLVLRNLLENAVKYAPGPSPVWVNVGVDAGGGRVAIGVHDQGPGIPRQEQQAVFEKFIRGAAARTSGIRGTGVGLALSRQIVRAHGGDVELVSEPGQGSTFSVWLPAVPAGCGMEPSS